MTKNNSLKKLHRHIKKQGKKAKPVEDLNNTAKPSEPRSSSI
jgi:hypothetical protein